MGHSEVVRLLLARNDLNVNLESPFSAKGHLEVLLARYQINTLTREEGRYSGKQLTPVGWAPNAHRLE